MSLILSGTDGLSDVDGTAATPAIRGTDANTGIFFGTDIIGFSEGGVEAARFDSSGQLGIGTTTPDALLHVYKTSGKAATFGNNVNNNGNYIVLGGTLSNKNWVLANNMIVGGEFGVGRTSANGGTTIGSAYDLMIDTNGGVKVANTLGVGYTTPSTSGAGITFPATQSASSDANTLDDYEEGTYTPSQSNFVTTGTVTITGRYVKVGSLVHFNVKFESTGTISYGTSAFISTPFAVKQATGNITMRNSPNSTTFNSNQSGAQCTTDEVGASRFFVGSFTATSAGQILMFAGTFEQN